MKNFIKCYFILLFMLISFPHQTQAMQQEDPTEGQRSRHVSQAAKARSQLPFWFASCSYWVNMITDSLSYYYKLINPGGVLLRLEGVAFPLANSERIKLGNNTILSPDDQENHKTDENRLKKLKSFTRVSHEGNPFGFVKNGQHPHFLQFEMFQEPTIDSLKREIYARLRGTRSQEYEIHPHTVLPNFDDSFPEPSEDDEIDPQAVLPNFQDSLPEPSREKLILKLKRNTKASIKKLRKINQTKLLIKILTKNKNVESITILNKKSSIKSIKVTYFPVPQQVTEKKLPIVIQPIVVQNPILYQTVVLQVPVYNPSLENTNLGALPPIEEKTFSDLQVEGQENFSPLQLLEEKGSGALPPVEEKAFSELQVEGEKTFSVLQSSEEKGSGALLPIEEKIFSDLQVEGDKTFSPRHQIEENNDDGLADGTLIQYSNSPSKNNNGKNKIENISNVNFSLLSKLLGEEDDDDDEEDDTDEYDDEDENKENNNVTLKTKK